MLRKLRSRNDSLAFWNFPHPKKVNLHILEYKSNERKPVQTNSNNFVYFEV